MLTIPDDAVGLKLFRITRRGQLIANEAVRFVDGSKAIDTILRRAAISGRVEIGGRVDDYLADVLDDNGDLIETVALDRNSYRALKHHWMRCKVEETV